MRIAISIVVWLAVLFSGGCAIYEKETTNRGGYLDAVLDDHWMKADSKGMRALRAFAMQVSLARVASVSAKNDSDRQLLAIRIGALTKRFIPIYLCAFNNNPLGVEGAKNDPCFYYDSAMVDYSTGLFDLAMIALPLDDAKRLMNVVTGAAVNPINIADLLGALLQIGKDAIKYGRIVGALYRDTVELEVQVWLGTPPIDTRAPPFRVVEGDVATLRQSYEGGNDNMPVWLAAIGALRDQGLQPLPQPKFFGELAGLMNYICDLITTDPKANNSNTCKANLPKTLPAPAVVLGSPANLRIGDTRFIPTQPVGATQPAGNSSTGRSTANTGTQVRNAPAGTGQTTTSPAKPDATPTPTPTAETTAEILIRVLKSGNAETRKAMRDKLQDLLSEASVKPQVAELPEPDRSKPVIESVAVTQGQQYDVVRGRLIEAARKQGLFK
jgi:hypothetical protein